MCWKSGTRTHIHSHIISATNSLRLHRQSNKHLQESPSVRKTAKPKFLKCAFTVSFNSFKISFLVPSLELSFLGEHDLGNDILTDLQLKLLSIADLITPSYLTIRYSNVFRKLFQIFHKLFFCVSKHIPTMLTLENLALFI